MSDNKNKYFVVSKTFVVRARNKSEAENLSRNARSRQVLWTSASVDNIPAQDAHQIAASIS